MTKIQTNQREKEKKLILKLFRHIAKETVGRENLNKVSLSISDTIKFGANWCRQSTLTKIEIGLELPIIEKRADFGFSNYHYEGRTEKVNKYILHNRHNTIRFILYHELKHAKDFIKNRNESESEEESKADDWAIKHLEGVK